MNRALITVAAVWLLAGSTFGYALPAAAAPGTSGTSSNSSAAVSSLASQHEEAVVGLMLLERRLADAKAGVERAERALDHTEKALGARADEVERSTKDLRTAETRLAERVRETYVRGPLEWIEFLGDSASLSALLDRLDLIRRVLGQEARLTEAIAAARREGVEAKGQLEALREDQRKTVVELQRRRAALQQAGQEQASLAETLGERLDAARETAQKARARMAALNAAARASSPGAEGPSAARGQERPAPTRAAPPRTVAPTAGAWTETAAPARTGRTIGAKVTAYALRGSTASGVPAGPGIIAVDPRLIPLGTRVYVPGWGEGIAADTGGDITGNWIDVWLPTQAQALDWGIRYVTITILD